MLSAFEQSHRYEQQYVFLKLCVLFLEKNVFILYTVYLRCVNKKQHHFRGKFRLHDNLRQII